MQINLTRGKLSIVDDAIFDLLNSIKWCVSYSKRANLFYAVTNQRDFLNKKKLAYLHHYIVGHPLNRKVVDHINGNTLDNRRENLRIVSRIENSINCKRHRDGKLPGAVLKKDTFRKKPWSCSFKGKFFGYFKTEQEASLAYKNIVSKHLNKH